MGKVKKNGGSLEKWRKLETTCSNQIPTLSLELYMYMYVCKTNYIHMYVLKYNFVS